MDRSLLAHRYALALYEYATESGLEIPVFTQIKTLAEVWVAVPELKKALLSPMVDEKTRLRLLENATGSTNEPVLASFFNLVVKNNRLMLIGRIARAFIGLWNDRHGIVKAELITVGEVGSKLSKQMEDLVQKAVGDKHVEFSRSYNPDIIGGFIMQVEDLRIDASVRNELDNIKMNLLQ